MANNEEIRASRILHATVPDPEIVWADVRVGANDIPALCKLDGNFLRPGQELSKPSLRRKDTATSKGEAAEIKLNFTGAGPDLRPRRHHPTWR